MREALRLLRRYQLPLGSVALAALVSLVFWPLVRHFPFVPFIAAVMVSAWRGGLRDSLLATALAAPALAAVWFAWGDAGQETGQQFVVRLGVFGFVGLLAGFVSRQCHRAVSAFDHFHGTLASAGDALVSTDAGGRVTFLNAQAETLTGRATTSAAGQPLDQVVRLTDEDTRQPLPLPTARVLQERVPFDLPAGAVLLDGEGGAVPVEGKLAPVREAGGEVVGALLTFRDVGPRRRAEQELRRREEEWRELAEGAPGGLLLLDRDGRCTWANRTAQALCGCPGEQVRGDGWAGFVHPADREALLAGWTHALQDGHAYTAGFRMHTRNGDVRWVLLRTAPLLSARNQLLGHAAVLEDVSARQLAEEAQRQAQEETDQLRQELTRLQAAADEAARRARAEATRQLQEQATAHAQAEAAAQKARQELERKLQELAAARQKAEQAWRDREQQLRSQLDEHTGARQKAEEELGQTKDELRRQADEHAAGLQETEKALAQLQAEADGRVQEHITARRQAEEELRQLHLRLEEHASSQRQAEEQAATRAKAEEDYRKQLAEHAAGRQWAEEELRKAWEELARRDEEKTTLQARADAAQRQARADLDSQVAALRAEHEQTLAALRDELARARQTAPPPVSYHFEEEPAPAATGDGSPRSVEEPDWLAYN